ncbi:MAG TPA: SEC-C metal-binding domain-containing protein [Isosphaeraceae bacterium]|nr:SEC-C metal-binding domain-containing protein [Isosphaeraceae bacterium]
MGAIAEAFVAYAQPLLDQTDGSQEQLNKALAISQLCYNLALLPDDQRDTMLDEMRQKLGMEDAEFAEFRQAIIVPMIRRHEAMFPGMRRLSFGDSAPSSSTPQAHTRKVAPGEKYPGTDRYAPCPCGSGEKYKFCCGAKRR